MTTTYSHHIADLQRRLDDHFHADLMDKTHDIHDIQMRIGILNDSIATMRRHYKRNTPEVNLEESYKTLDQFQALWTSMKDQYPALITDDNVVLLPKDVDLKRVKIDDLERLMDNAQNLLQQEQGRIPEITQMLKLSVDLNDILSKIIAEMAKEEKRKHRTPIDNMVRG
jgi:hypothetical protein